jgi:predicted ATPase
VILNHVIGGQTRRGRYSDGLVSVRRLLHLIPWNEEIHAKAMRLLAWTGQRGSALRQFESCRQSLWEELGVQPSEETTFLFQQIQAGKLDLPPQVPAFLTEEEARHAFVRPLFVGREGELARLSKYLNGALAGKGRVIFTTGGPGRGKTALLDAFCQQALEMHPDLLVAGGKCSAYSGVGDPYLPFRDVMAMLTGDVEGRWDAGAITRDHAWRLWAAFPIVLKVLLDHGPHLLDVLVPGEALLSRSAAAGQEYVPWLSRLREQVKRDWTRTMEVEQSYLFQQIVKVLRIVANEKPLLITLDDIQWADAASISLLFHLGRCLADVDSRLIIICAYRPEEVALGQAGQRHPLAKVLSELKRTFGNVWLNLGRAKESEERRFVNALLDAEPNRLTDEFRTALFDRTGGHPLFTVELLRTMQDRGDLIKDVDGVWIEIEAVIEERIDRLEPDLQDILTIASVEGEMFTANVVAEVRNVPERSALHRLSQDLERRHRLVIEQGEVETGQRRLTRFRFGHVLFQNYLYKRLGQGERRLLHGDIAAVLEVLYEGQLDEMAVQLAHHFHQAGDHGRAFHYYSLAAERAARLHESGEAIAHYTRAIQLAEKISPDVASLAGLHSGRGLAFERLGEFDLAQSDHIATLQLAGVNGEDRVAWRARLDLGRLWASRDYEQARDFFESALELARRMNDTAVLAGSLNWMGNWYANAEHPVKAIEYHREAGQARAGKYPGSVGNGQHVSW